MSRDPETFCDFENGSPKYGGAARQGALCDVADQPWSVHPWTFLSVIEQ